MHRLHRISLLAVFAASFASCGDGPTNPSTPPAVARRPASIALRPDSVVVTVGGSRVLVAEVRDQFGQVMTNHPAISWSVSDPEIAAITSYGEVLAYKPGLFRVTASLASLSANANGRAREVPQLVLQDTVVTVTTIGDIVPLRATADGEPVSDLAFTLLSDTRLLDEVPVVAALGSRAVARGPGEAILSVSAPLTKETSVRILVRPSRPVVYSVRSHASRAGDGDTVTIRGYLAGLSPDAVTLDGKTVRLLHQDSLHLSFAAASAPVTPCALSATGRVAVSGAQVISPLTFPRARLGEIQLEAGEAMSLAPSDLECLRTVPGAEYLLAFQDPRLLSQARSTALTYEIQDTFTVSITDLITESTRSLLPSRSLSLAQSGALPPIDLPSPARASLASRSDLSIRSSPFRVGETFTYTPLHESWGTSKSIQVIKIYDNHFVLAAPVDEAHLWSGRLLASFDSAMAYMVAEGLPLLERSLESGRPQTAATGQSLMVAKLYNPDYDTAGGMAYFGWTEFWFGGRARAETWIQVLAHEMTHYWHFYHRQKLYQRIGGHGSWEQWNVEGLAAFMSNEVVRRHYDFPFVGNIEPAIDHTARGYYFMNAIVGNGAQFSAGYRNAGNFFRDLMQRLHVERGLSQDEALRIVVQAAAAGWYGCSSYNCLADGLGDVMPRHFSGWTPSDALLDWQLSQGADDRTTNSRFQNLTWKHASALGPHTFAPLATLSAGNRTSVSISAMAMSAAYFVLRDPNIGGAFQITYPADLRWKILRVK